MADLLVQLRAAEAAFSCCTYAHQQDSAGERIAGAHRLAGSCGTAHSQVQCKKGSGRRPWPAEHKQENYFEAAHVLTGR